MSTLDATDLKLLVALVEDPRAQIAELSARVGVARNTVQSRLKRLERAGVLRGTGRDVDLAALGYDVVAFITLEVVHRELDAVIAGLRRIPTVLEAYEISGRGDLWCRLVAADTHELQASLRQVLRIRGVIRSETVLALHAHVEYRADALLRRAAEVAAAAASAASPR
ncbi:AsnC family transcriptional regulator [Sinomonas cyclohexanicum]|uniref:AsnC family transcriptional regulator n=1 Tax=Sinomonas cyclohexanicum TaxID=322009 RepID=A0ABN6FJM3_SINCY|nr:Lrp/AsnC family transcriptional regulator [Corynebacterium cyclohexanicum]BCT76971.1 AsnC family transcriptional regulator [Corynebacterium cyclohexanicum]